MSSICIKCGKEHDGTFGSGKFCSRQCSNSRNWTESDRQKKSASATKRLKAGKWGCLTNESRAQRIYTSKSWAEKVSSRPFEEMHFDYKRQKILLEQNYKCAICSINEWLGQQLSLEIDHKDGNHKNDERKWGARG